jgi:hypothetical protein
MERLMYTVNKGNGRPVSGDSFSALIELFNSQFARQKQVSAVSPHTYAAA